MYKTAKVWDTYDKTSAKKILADRHAGKKRWNDRCGACFDFFTPCNSVRSNIEFLVLHEFFMETHLLPLGKGRERET